MSSSHLLRGLPARRDVGRLSWTSGSQDVTRRDHRSWSWLASRCAQRHLSFQEVLTHSSKLAFAAIASARCVVLLMNSGQGSRMSWSGRLTRSFRGGVGESRLLMSSVEVSLVAAGLVGVGLVGCTWRRGEPIISRIMRCWVALNLVCMSFVVVHEMHPYRIVGVMVLLKSLSLAWRGYDLLVSSCRILLKLRQSELTRWSTSVW